MDLDHRTELLSVDALALERSQYAEFVAELGLDPTDPPAVHRYSVVNFCDFWGRFLDWTQVPHAGVSTPVCVGDDVEHARFWPGLSLNYTEVLLHGVPTSRDDHIAVIARDESGERVEITRANLRRRVEAAARGFSALGLHAGDRVVAVARNDLDTIVAMLAAAGLGAVWSSVACDLGVAAILARFETLTPRWLLAHSATCINGRRQDQRATIAAVLQELPSVEFVVDLGGGGAGFNDLGLRVSPLTSLEAPGAGVAWPRFPFDHPLFVMFSSGTTGRPKCIVHGAGGTLLEHLKEHRLHGDLGPGDRLFFQTSCGWMMWNWQVGALAAGATVVVREGSATYPTNDALWSMVSEEKVTVFGASPAFLQFCHDAQLSPKAEHDLSSLRAMQSTGSVLHDHQFDWFIENVGRLPLQSISGGTDILGCFVLGHPGRPLIRGESQSVSLAMDIHAIGRDGHDVSPGEVGELVCRNPFPSRPIYFLGDPAGSGYHETYFAQNSGVWTHGDFIELHEDLGARMHGRSDGVMNIRGVRIGPAEIYNVMTGVPEVMSCLAVEQQWEGEVGGSRIVLLLVLREGVTLDRPLTLRIKKLINDKTSRVHVPGLIVAVSDIPTTFNGKFSEKAARDAVNGIASVNESALRNPGVLSEIREACRG